MEFRFINLLSLMSTGIVQYKVELDVLANARGKRQAPMTDTEIINKVRTCVFNGTNKIELFISDIF